MSARAVVLCADDYGMSAGVSRAILDLAEAGRLSATSAMTNMPDWAGSAGALRRLSGRVGIGLHLTLTGGRPLGPMPGLAPDGAFPTIGRLLRLSLGGRLDEREVAAEIARQWDAFTAALGREPDFVDGHQHVHVLPGIRGALLRHLEGRRLWVRDPGDRPDRIVLRGRAVAKATVVAALSAGFVRGASRAGLAVNRGFAGFSTFEAGRDLERDFASYLAAPGPAHLVMCHPGIVATGERLDGTEAARRAEHAYLASEGFAALLARRSVRLVPAPL